jgi:hypothetical protein
MDHRKDYVAPTIAAEDVLEQTSLACNLSQYDPNDKTLIGPNEMCRVNVAKGGAFIPDFDCTQSPGEGPVVLS